MEDRATTAYHEAGHAVASYRLGLNGFAVSIVPAEDGSRGRLISEVFIENHDDCIKEAVCLFAGLEAEKAFYPEASPAGSWQDDEQARQLLTIIDGSEAELRGRAASLVKENWQAVEAIALMLIQHEKLEYEEWETIIDSIDAGEDWKAEFYRAKEAMRRLKGA